ncbi:hypothetical protein YC2023_036588 [Brassica napus]
MKHKELWRKKTKLIRQRRCHGLQCTALEESGVYVSLKGGILKYLEEVPKTESFWEGKYFVFDKRASVEHGLAQGTHKLCYGCKQPLVMKTWKLQSMSMEFLVFTIGYGPISPSGPES